MSVLFITSLGLLCLITLTVVKVSDNYKWLTDFH